MTPEIKHSPSDATSESDVVFVQKLVRFARALTLANGSLGTIAATISFANTQIMTGCFYLAGTIILFSASFLLTRKLNQLKNAE